ncbi:MAG: trigger factor, partial [Firmicutes bacterium]|nr:trigger factor [Candidatus Colimorpha enterica]
MSLKSTNKLNANTVELIFNIDKKSFDDAVNSVYKKEAAKITIPGFRKGKAPRAIVEKMYGTGFFYDEAINQIAPYAYGAALDEAGEQPVGQADFEILTIDDNGVDIKATFPVKPECKIEGYKGIEVERKVLPVTDADVDARIDAARHRNSRTVDVEGRAAADGDIAVIDYEGSVDGVPFEGGKGSDYDLKLGSNTFIPGFEAQIVGHNIGENFDVNVTFPEDYHAEELKGKAAVFAVALKGLKAEELPALDDEFAKDVSEFDTFDEYKADIKKNIENEHKDQADREVSDKIFEALADKLEADIPEAMYANEVEQQINDFEYRLQSSGLKMDMYLKY